MAVSYSCNVPVQVLIKRDALPQLRAEINQFNGYLCTRLLATRLGLSARLHTIPVGRGEGGAQQVNHMTTD